MTTYILIPRYGDMKTHILGKSMKAVREWLWINLCEQHDTYIKKTNSRSYLGWCDDYDATTPLSDEAKEVHASLMKCKDISDVYKWMQSHPKQDNDLWGKIEEHY